MSRPEDTIVQFLKKAKISFEREKTFTDLKNNKYRFDFYIPNYKGKKVLIEYDGEEHFYYIKYFHKTPQNFKGAKERDRIKNAFALAHGIALYRIPYFEFKNIKNAEDLFDSKFLVKSKFHTDKIITQKNR